MEALTALLRQLGQLFHWWVCVAPWEQALRVRAGKHVIRLGAGVHLRLPFLDVVHVQSVRLRVAHMQLQTIATRDGQSLTLGATIGYSIADIEKLYRTLHHAQDTIVNLAALAIADVCVNTYRKDLTPATLASMATAKMDLERFGITDVRISVTDYAFVRAYRLINDQRWGAYGDTLTTQAPQ